MFIIKIEPKIDGQTYIQTDTLNHRAALLLINEKSYSQQNVLKVKFVPGFLCKIFSLDLQYTEITFISLHFESYNLNHQLKNISK